MKKNNGLAGAVMLALLLGGAAVGGANAVHAEEPMEFAMEEYVVTASRTQTARVDTPANISVIDAERLESRRYQDVAEALKDVPGAAVLDSGTGAYEKKVMLNGDERVLVLVDGRRVNIDMGTMTRSSFDLNQLPDVSQIERIEIVKGHGGALYGSDAVGGVINIITKKLDHTYGKVSMAFGSNQARDGKALYTIKEGRTGISVAGSKYKQGYYKFKDAADDSTRRWPGQSDYSNEKVSLKLAQELSDKSNLEIGYDFSKLSGFNPSNALSPYYNYVDKKTNTFYAKYDWRLKDSDQGYLQVYRSKYEYENAGGMEENSYGLELQQEFTLSERNKLVAGASYRSSKAMNELSYTSEHKINNKALFVSDMWEFAPSWTFNAGARWDDHSTAGDKTTLSAGLNKKFDENSHAYINWGQVFKAPTIDDLYYYSDMSAWGYGIYSGNPDLDPESGDTWTVGYGTRIAEKTDLDISCFYSDLKDAIDWEYDNMGNGYVRNIDEQKKRGLEISVKHELNDNWDLNASYTYVRIRNNDAGQGFVRDANFTPNTYRLGVRYHDAKWNADLALRAGSGADTSVKYHDYYSGLPVQSFADSSYVTLDMAVSYKPDSAWTVFAKGYNLTNSAYAETAQAVGGRYEHPAQARRFLVGAEYSF